MSSARALLQRLAKLAATPAYPVRTPNKLEGDAAYRDHRDGLTGYDGITISEPPRALSLGEPTVSMKPPWRTPEPKAEPRPAATAPAQRHGPGIPPISVSVQDITGGQDELPPQFVPGGGTIKAPIVTPPAGPSMMDRAKTMATGAWDTAKGGVAQAGSWINRNPGAALGYGAAGLGAVGLLHYLLSSKSQPKRRRRVTPSTSIA